MEFIAVLLCLSFLFYGPSPLPVVGNLLKIDKNLHRSFAELAKTYGPLMSLKLGTKTAIIVSSPSMAKQVLQKHDQSFSSRTVPDAAHALNNHKFSVAWLPPSSQWRNLRRICNSQMFTTSRLDANQALRHNKVKELVTYIDKKCRMGQAIDIGQAVFSTTLNLISNTMFSIDLAHLNSETAQEFKFLVRGVLEEAGRSNLSDYFPVLKFVDPQGVRQRMTIYFEKLDKIFGGIINQRLESNKLGTSDDLLDKLLQCTQEDNSELIRPHVNALLRRAGCLNLELKQAIEKDKPVEESDIARLPYLQAIVKETFRLHPPAPLLIPRRAETETDVCGFTVPKNALVMVNIWAIGQDPDTWASPTLFNPDRFLGCDINFRGYDFELTPFGAGKRICPGLPLAYRMVHLMLASLIHLYDWKLEDGIKPEDVNMEEKFGITLQKAESLRAIPIQD
ncbi:hypothetical protein GIB67_006091 [Kingdonia uniflora]|uniref:Cytochrome P450 n=1 Tax=Kingdonia uniflora TaxID=39325 RepID=A0A7J7LPV8_9MAGN|nr:hypothetical protein GIB67_006091 [Kingdonia uniflora]